MPTWPTPGVVSDWTSDDGYTQLLQRLVSNTYAIAQGGGGGGSAWGSITGTLSDQTDLQAALDAKASLAGASFTGANTITLNSLSTTPTAALSLLNTTAAAAGAQQVSPSLLWGGQGWKTNATAASQSVQFRANVLPIQGSASPTGSWQLQSSINGGAFNNVVQVTDGGNMTINSGILGSGGSLTWASRGGMSAQADGTFALFSNGFAANFQFVVEANHTLARRNSTNAQVDRLYRTFTDASNYERLALQSGAGYFELACETAGTGTDNIDLRLTPVGTGLIDYRVSATADAAVASTHTARIKISGTEFKVLLATP